MTEVSLYTFDHDYGWGAVHRLPYKTALRTALAVRASVSTPLAIVPDGADPSPYFQAIAVGMPTMGLRS